LVFHNTLSQADPSVGFMNNNYVVGDFEQLLFFHFKILHADFGNPLSTIDLDLYMISIPNQYF